MNETNIRQKMLEIAQKSLGNPEFAARLKNDFKQTLQEEGIDCASLTVQFELVHNDNKTLHFVLPFQNGNELNSEELSDMVAAKTNNPSSLGTFPTTVSTADVAHLNKTHYYSCKGEYKDENPLPTQ